MELGLSQAYHGVYCSSREILNSNQRHLFCNMLDLLTRTCKTTGIAGSKIVTEDQVRFWLTQILPLMFDKENSIQSSAISALEYGLKALDVHTIQKSTNWSDIRTTIVGTYVPKIHDIRESKNSNWYKIWCILIRILNKDVLKGSSTINTFLSIVEHGFRSLDYTVRVESFICWRLLIEILAEHNEICSPKRIKLICIPLKSSQSKTFSVAEIKLRVWWFLICKIKPIEPHFSAVVEPFLGFCFGCYSNNISSSTKLYPALKKLTVACLSSMLTKNKNEIIERNMKMLGLEPLSTCFISKPLFEKYWQPITYAAVEAIKTIVISSENDDIILQVLINDTLQNIFESNTAFIHEYIFDEIAKLLSQHVKLAVYTINKIATAKIVQGKSAKGLKNLEGVLSAFTRFFVVAKPYVPKAILQKCISNVFDIDSSCNTYSQWDIKSTAFNIILKSNDEENYNSFETKIMIWNFLSSYTKQCKTEYHVQEKSGVIHSWIIWPLKIYSGFEGTYSPSYLDHNFCEIWKQLLNSSHNSFNRESFLIEVGCIFQDILKNKKNSFIFCELFDAFSYSTLQLHIDENTNHQKKLFQLFCTVIAQTSELNCVPVCLITLKNFIVGSTASVLEVMFGDIKELLFKMMKCDGENRLPDILFEDFKRTLVEKYKSHPNKTYIKQIKEILKKDDVYVIIPSVWSLNPDKLTDRQKEKYTEKADIPALYNDMSQSQDSFIKPWTPNKVVIVKEAQNEILINRQASKTSVTEKTEMSTISEMHKNSNTDILNEVETKSNNMKSIRPLTKEEEDLLKKFKIHIAEGCDDRKIRSILNNLKSLDIDTVDGETYRMGNGERSKRRTTNCNDNQLKDGKVMSVDCMIDQQCKSGSFHSTCKTNKTEDKNSDNPAYKPPDNLPASFLQTRSSSISPDQCAIKKNESMPSETCTMISSKVETPLKTSLLHKKYDNICENGKENFASNCEAESEALINELNLMQPFQQESNLFLNHQRTTVCYSTSENRNTKNLSLKNSPSKIVLLTSPPDRNITNNSSSPMLKPKPVGHLTGRGAQLINMIRNRRCDSSTFVQNTQAKSFDSDNVVAENNSQNILASTSLDSELTSLESSDLLIFSKRLPSPTASPSASILKRKNRCDSIEDTATESPALKRKRVSFHDPPVSITKEYISDTDGNKPKPKRCLSMDKSLSVKHILQRKTKLENFQETEMCSTEQSKEIVPISLTANCITNSDHYIPKNNGNCFTTSNKITDSSSDLIFKSNDDLLKYVVMQYPMDEVLQTFLAYGRPLDLTSANHVSKIISNNMKDNLKMKLCVMETLSEDHSKDFLDHAVQENLSSVVCDRLNLSSVIDFVIAKSKINAQCRSNLLAQIPEIFKESKSEAERYTLICNLIQSIDITDDNIFYLIKMLINNRANGEIKAGNESESAIDSSSNL